VPSWNFFDGGQGITQSRGKADKPVAIEVPLDVSIAAVNLSIWGVYHKNYSLVHQGFDCIL